MSSAAIAFPVLPGKLDQAKRFAAEVKSRSDEFARSVAGQGLTREDWYIQSTPQGDMVIVVMEGVDPLQTMHSWAESRAPFDVWFKTQAQEISGIDFNQPVPGLPEHAFAWKR
jgi:hypothetical protein